MDYKTTATPRATIGDIPVFCAFDELVDIGKVVPNPKNPNTHPKSQIELLAKIIRAQGWRSPITVSNRSGLIVKGHGRLQAAILLETDKVPVDYQNYATEAEEIADLTADNRLAELADMNTTMLADVLAEFDTGEMPLELTGYTESDMEEILASIAGGDDAEPNDQDTDREQPLPPMSKPGDLWILGSHRLICGDATNEDTINLLMDGETGAMVHTDPPYGVSYETKSGKFGMIRNDEKTHDELYNRLLLPVFNLYRKHTKERAAFYIWHASSTRRDFEDAMTAAGLMEVQYLIWAKNGISLGRSDYQWAHEPCFYAAKAGETPAFYGDRSQHTIWRVTTRSDGSMNTVLGGGGSPHGWEGRKALHRRQAPEREKTPVSPYGGREEPAPVPRGSDGHCLGSGQGNEYAPPNAETGGDCSPCHREQQQTRRNRLGLLRRKWEHAAWCGGDGSEVLHRRTGSRILRRDRVQICTAHREHRGDMYPGRRRTAIHRPGERVGSRKRERGRSSRHAHPCSGCSACRPSYF